MRIDRVHTQRGCDPGDASLIERAESGKGKRTAEFGGAGSAFTGNNQIVPSAGGAYRRTAITGQNRGSR